MPPSGLSGAYCLRRSVRRLWCQELPFAPEPRLLHPTRYARSARTNTTSARPPDPPRIAQTPESFKPAIPILIVLITALGAGYVYYDARAAQDGIHINPTDFTPCATIHSREPFSSTSSIFTLNTSFSRKVLFDKLWSTGIWSIEVKQPDLQIARRYTPLPPLDVGSSGTHTAHKISALAVRDLRFLMRRYQAGEMSNYLSRLPVNSIVQLRGGHMEYVLPEEIGRVVFIAAGTGIAPALQVAHALSVRGNLAEHVGRDDGKRKGSGIQTRMNILWASRKRDDAFGRDDTENASRGAIMEQIKTISSRRGINSVEIDTRCFFDEEQHFIQAQDLKAAVRGKPAVAAVSPTQSGWFSRNNAERIEEATIPLDVAPKGRQIIIVSGPDGFVEYIAGRRQKVDGQAETGLPKAGLLSQMDLAGWEVVKL